MFLIPGPPLHCKTGGAQGGGGGSAPPSPPLYLFIFFHARILFSLIPRSRSISESAEVEVLRARNRRARCLRNLSMPNGSIVTIVIDRKHCRDRIYRSIDSGSTINPDSGDGHRRKLATMSRAHLHLLWIIDSASCSLRWWISIVLHAIKWENNGFAS